MDGYATRIAASLVAVGRETDEARETDGAREMDRAVDVENDVEFDAELVQSSTLAFRVAYSVLRHHQDAEDVAQEALVRAHRRLQQLRHRDRFRGWLVRLTWRLAIDRRRTDQRRTAREATHAREQPAVVTNDEVTHSIGRERAAALWRAIDELPEKLRVVIVLANIREHDLDEVARLLRLPVGTVKSRLFAGRTKLRELLS